MLLAVQGPDPAEQIAAERKVHGGKDEDDGDGDAAIGQPAAA